MSPDIALDITKYLFVLDEDGDEGDESAFTDHRLSPMVKIGENYIFIFSARGR